MVKFSRKVASLFVSFISLAFGNCLGALAMEPGWGLVTCEDNVIEIFPPEEHVYLTPYMYERFFHYPPASLYRDTLGNLYFVDGDSDKLEGFRCFGKQVTICDEHGLKNKAWEDIKVHECFC